MDVAEKNDVENWLREKGIDAKKIESLYQLSRNMNITIEQLIREIVKN